MKGIILAGGTGGRLYPATQVLSKQLIPIYDKPMIYYPLSLLMLAGIREILLIVGPDYLSFFKKLLGDGSTWGLQIDYVIQKRPNGIAEAFLIGEEFIDKKPCALVLGDNLFFGNEMPQILQGAAKKTEGATLFAYKVKDPENYGVIEFKEGRVVSIEEKPQQPKSRYVATGLYFYDHKVSQFAHTLKPSLRGELEITDINRLYLEAGELEVKILSRGIAWLDMGTFDSLIDAELFVATIQRRQGTKVACLEEIAYRLGYITKEELLKIAHSMSNSYGQYLKELLEESP